MTFLNRSRLSIGFLVPLLSSPHIEISLSVAAFVTFARCIMPCKKHIDLEVLRRYPFLFPKGFQKYL
jgi:hypothetical protein